MNTATSSQPIPQHILSPVRSAVKTVLQSSPEFQNLPADRQRALANAMVKLTNTAVQLIDEEAQSHEKIQQLRQQAIPELAETFAASDQFGGNAARQVAGTTRAILNAVSFPRFVSELVTGVFKAVSDSSLQQMNNYVELLNNVSASVEGFADANYAPAQARQWLAERFPAEFEVRGASEADADPMFADDPDFAEPNSGKLVLRSGASWPSDDAIRAQLGLEPDETVPRGDPENSLVPFARRKLAQNRQQLLASLVRMGMQRIVIDSGKVNASMRFHINTRSAAQSDQGSSFDFRHTSSVAGKFGVGPWGASASMQNTIGYVNTQRDQTTEELNTDLELNSSVELNFHSDYVPLNRMATKAQQTRIMSNSRNPSAEFESARKAEAKQRDAQSKAEGERSKRLDKAVAPRPGKAPKLPKVPEPEKTKKTPVKKQQKQASSKKDEKKTTGVTTKQPAKRTTKEPGSTSSNTANKKTPVKKG